MTDYRQLAARDARKYRLSPRIFRRQIGQESGFNPNAVSPAGARGIAQFMPGTAAGLGLNPGDPVASLDAAAKLMRSYLDKYGSYRDALVAYNAGPGRVGGPLPGETQRYVANILGGGPVPQAPAHSPASAGGGTLLAAKPEKVFDQAAYDTARKRFVLADLIARQPGGTAKNPLFASGLLSTTPPAPADFVTTRLGVTSRNLSAPGPATVGNADGGGGGGRLNVRGRGKFTIFGANPGRIKPAVIRFAEKVSAVYGHPLRGDSGATHSKYTVDGNVSDHWTGHATDIPATGKTLLAMGRAALIAAGMPRAQAMKQTGGLFNVNGHQVIFLTMQGGNHYTHLHISAY